MIHSLTTTLCTCKQMDALYRPKTRESSSFTSNDTSSSSSSSSSSPPAILCKPTALRGVDLTSQPHSFSEQTSNSNSTNYSIDSATTGSGSRASANPSLASSGRNCGSENPPEDTCPSGRPAGSTGSYVIRLSSPPRRHSTTVNWVTVRHRPVVQLH